jgi:tetraacyldisaccharide 4'-kinase
MILVRIIAFPVALIYGLIIRIRNYFYDVGIFSSYKFDTPTICVGNLSLGGTGKTPMVEFLVSELQEAFRIAVLSRGYRRKSRGFVLASSKSTVGELGDEPYLLYKKFPEITVAVDADRSNGIHLLENKLKPNLILLDDAFQHRKVRPSLSILLTAYNKLYCDDYFLPTGSLRDSGREAKRANIIVVTKCPSNLSEVERNQIVKKLRPNPSQKVLFSFLEYGDSLKGGTVETTLVKLKERPITLVTGIADPEPLINYLNNMGLDFEHLRYNDHHTFSKREIEHLKSKELILTTEKDFVRLQGRIKDSLYIEVGHNFFGKGAAELIAAIEGVTKRSS